MAEIEPNRSSNRTWHLVATLPAGLFILMARVAPPVLWNADGLVYCGPLVTAAFIALPAATLSLPRFLLPPSVRQAVVGALSYRYPERYSSAPSPCSGPAGCARTPSATASSAIHAGEVCCAASGLPKSRVVHQL